MAVMNAVGKAVLDMGPGMKVTCESRKMQFVLDEPPELGGTDLGMNPVEALLNSLAACKCIVAKCFAGANGVELEGLTVSCKGVLDPDGFMGINPDVKIGFSEITTTYNFKTSSPKDKVDALVKYIESHCPVHDTLANPAKFECIVKV